MSTAYQLKILVSCVLLFLGLMSRPVFAQVDLSGEWDSEDARG